MEYYGPYIGRAMWDLYLAINWTHMHHEQTYDILSAADVPWDKKKEWTDRAVRYYVEEMPGIARSSVLNAVNVRACKSRRKFSGGGRPSILSMTRMQCGSE